MKIILTQSPLERLATAIERLQDAGKTVQRVVVTKGEMDALLDCPFGPDREDPLGQRSCLKDHQMFVMGVPVVVAFPEPGDAIAADVDAGIPA